MIRQMFYLIKKDPTIKFSFKVEEYYIPSEINNGILHQPYNNNGNNYSLGNEHLFDVNQFFNIKSFKKRNDEDLLFEANFYQEMRFFYSCEDNDSITLSSNLLNDFDELFSIFNRISKNVAFTKLCRSFLIIVVFLMKILSITNFGTIQNGFPQNSQIQIHIFR